MFWIALLPPEEEGVSTLATWGWWALQFTPRVAQLDEALVAEVSASERLWGGRKALLKRFLEGNPVLQRARAAFGATALIALARLRKNAKAIGELPLETLTAAREHVATLHRVGCRSWGELRALPRDGVARRFGAALLDALDEAYGDRPSRHTWLRVPETFDVRIELPALASSAPELLWSANRLLGQLQVWLRARQHGVLALELEWTLDQKKLDGVALPEREHLQVRTAQPVQEMAHLKRLVGEQLDRTLLRAPANHLRIRSLETLPWGAPNTSLLPDEGPQGDRLHELVERLTVRLGANQVVMPVAQADHRPERMQRWVPAVQLLPQAEPPAALEGLVSPVMPDVIRHPVRRVKRPTGIPGQARNDRKGESPLYPPWLLPCAIPLQTDANDKPHWQGPLDRLTRASRVEGGWWEQGAQRFVRRDYFIARSPGAGLVWIYREQRKPSDEDLGAPHWFLHGLYA